MRRILDLRFDGCSKQRTDVRRIEKEAAMRTKGLWWWTWILSFGIWAFASATVTAQASYGADPPPV